MNATRLRFGRIEILPSERTLLIDKSSASVGARAFDLLLALAQRPTEPVSRDDLLDAAWGRKVEPSNVDVQICALRGLLGREAIVTIPGRGYQLALSRDEEDSPSPSPRPFHPVESTQAPAMEAIDATRLIGRADELQQLGSLLEHHRLCTVLGTAGVGKTVLAKEACKVFQQKSGIEVIWVGLTSVPAIPVAAWASTEASFLGEVARVLGVEPGATSDLLAVVIKALKARESLLVLDNVEHLVEHVAGLLNALAQQVTRTRVLVTSQAVLKVDEEQVLRLSPLDFPDKSMKPMPAAQAAQYPAVALLAALLTAADKRFALTDANAQIAIELCRCLDGLPLALKLAAARVRLLGLSGVKAGLTHRFSLLAAGNVGAPAHQRTLYEAIDWSHNLLSAQEQAIFRRLGVFVGGFTLELAVAAAGDQEIDRWAVVDILGSLLDRSLVETDAGDMPRFHFLESNRDFALLRLKEADEMETVLDRCAVAFDELFKRAEDDFWKMTTEEWFALYAPEVQNLLIFLEWSIENRPTLAISMAANSHSILKMKGLAHKARRYCDQLEPRVADVKPGTAARFWYARASLHSGLEFGREKQFCLKACELLRLTQDWQLLYVVLAHLFGRTLPPTPASYRMIDELKSLEQPEWPPRLRRVGKAAEAVALRFQDKLAESAAVIKEAMGLSDAAGDKMMGCIGAGWLLETYLALDDIESARGVLSTLRSEHNWYWRSYSTMALSANAMLVFGSTEEAREVLSEFIQISCARDWEELDYFSAVFCLLAACEGRLEDAARLIGYHDRARPAFGGRFPKDNHGRERAFARANAELDESLIDRLLSEGSMMTQDEFAALAMGAVKPKK